MTSLGVQQQAARNGGHRLGRSLLTAAASLTTLPALASSEGGGGSLVDPNPGTIFWTIVTFVILLVILGRFAWKPLIGAIEAREKSIQGDLEEAASSRSTAESLVAEQRELLTSARRERAEAVEQGKRDAERMKAEILEEARQQREQVLKDTQAQVAAGLRKAQADLRGTAVDLAILGAEKLLSVKLDDATQRRLVEEHLADLEGRSSGSASMSS
jgi:F-type H+-transporting ATPase subunit b